MTPDQYASVRHLAGDAPAATGFYTTHPGFTPNISAAPAPAPAFAGVVRGPADARFLLADPAGNLIELFQPAHWPANLAEAS